MEFFKRLGSYKLFFGKFALEMQIMHNARFLIENSTISVNSYYNFDYDYDCDHCLPNFHST